MLEPGLRNAIDKFSKMMMVTHKGYSQKNMIARYVKYVLKEGSGFEKTIIVRNLNIKLALFDRRIVRLDK